MQHLQSTGGEEKKSCFIEAQWKEFANQPVLLLGKPGDGKTWFLQHLADQKQGFFISAQTIIRGKLDSVPRNTKLLIDGFDEYLSFSPNKKDVLDSFTTGIRELGCPDFVLACRAQDWQDFIDTPLLKSELGLDDFPILCLSPFSDADILQYLAGVGLDPDEAFSEAKNLGITDLFRNPQTLSLLCATRLKEGGWPKDKRQLYERACLLLATERGERRTEKLNPYHLIAVAGELATLFLLSGYDAICSEHRFADEDTLYAPLSIEEKAERTATLSSQLFEPVDGNRVRFAHRTIAEYLAASHLAESIRAGKLTPRRVVALVTRSGGVPTSLRGLAGWLCILSQDAVARSLFLMDPLAVTHINGLSELSTATKRDCLQALEEACKQRPGFPHERIDEDSFGGLWDAQLCDDFSSILNAKDAPLYLKLAVIKAIQFGKIAAAKLAAAILHFIHSKNTPNFLRHKAIDAYSGIDIGVSEGLLRILEHIKNDLIEDKEQNCLGTLLRILYPTVITPDKLGEYLIPIDPHFFGKYWRFIRFELLPKTPHEQLSNLLDSLVKNSVVFQSREYSLHWEMMWECVLTCLEKSPTEAAPDRFWTWLHLLKDKYEIQKAYSPNRHSERLRAYLEKHPFLVDGLWTKLVNELTLEQFYESHVFFTSEIIPLPSTQYIDILFEHIKQIAISNPGHAKFLFRNVAVEIMFNEHFSDKPIEQLENLAAYNEVLSNAWEDSRKTDLTWRIHDKKRKQAERTKREAICSHFSNDVAGKINALLDGNDDGFLCHIATGYLYGYSDIHEEDPDKRLEALCGDALAEQVRQAFLNTLQREDLPSVKHVLSLHRQEKIDIIAYPFMAGLRLFAARDFDAFETLNTSAVQFAAAVWGTAGGHEDHAWLRGLVEFHGSLVAETLQEFFQTQLVEQRGRIRNIDELRHNEVLAPIARQIAFPLLCDTPSISWENEKELLFSCLRHLEPEQLRLHIQQQVKAEEINPYERILTYCALLFLLDPGVAEQNFLQTFQTESAIPHLTNLLYYRKDGLPQLTVQHKVLIVKCLMPFTSPHLPTGTYFASSHDRARDIISTYIDCFSSNIDAENTSALKSLDDEFHKSPWKYSIAWHIENQNRIRVDTGIQASDPETLLAALRGGRPATHADFHAAIMDLLFQLNDTIHSGKDNLVHLFWNEDTPKSEEACRDIVTSQLRPLLTRFGASLFREDHYRGEKRADITFSLDAMEIPLEAKGQWNRGNGGKRGVWSGIPDQLVPHYCIAPQAQGFGIFLVFWFGNVPGKNLPAPPDELEIAHPKTPQELEDALRQTTPLEYQKKIGVVCLDCSKE